MGYQLTCTKEGKTVFFTSPGMRGRGLRGNELYVDTAHDAAQQVFKIREQFGVHGTYSICCEPWPWWVVPAFWLQFAFVIAIVCGVFYVLYRTRCCGFCKDRPPRLSQCS